MNKYLFILVFLLVQGCASTKKKTLNSADSQSEGKNFSLVELTLKEKGEYFVWGKGDFLNLEGTITNKSKNPITILLPKTSYDVRPDYFKMEVSEDFDGMACAFEVAEEDERRKASEFLTIQPNESKVVLISGRNYFNKYCNYEKATLEEISLTLFYNYYEKAHDYTEESYFIANNYKVKLSDEDTAEIATQIGYMRKSSRLKNLSEEERNTKLKTIETSLAKKKINSTPQEQREIIQKFNSLFPKKLSSNTIVIKLEK